MTATNKTTSEILDTLVHDNPLVMGIVAQVSADAFRLSELAEAAENVESAPSLSELLKTADETLVSQYNATKEILKALEKEIRGGVEIADDSEAIVSEATDAYKRIKAALSFLSTQDGIPAEFGAAVLATLTPVKGARMRLNGGETIKRYVVNTVSVQVPGEDSPWTFGTFTEAAISLTKDKGLPSTTASEIGFAFASNGGEALNKGESVTFDHADCTFTVTK